ncbi:uncharacterized protein DSM5745_04485 [Aspergillus mulundensis]|uniref:Uncharacterized protein n=1 Tax=Aspergillus mulundensis TaxID=1810919 RepID=A0A3D8SCX8_9EURO|nr:hypothetical protein DSM5745_04485 [Aspergillus mulundensis]RDW84159.1 hypothetical protein DSM5745_04485 [Aspergillus mulundensis]
MCPRNRPPAVQGAQESDIFPCRRDQASSYLDTLPTLPGLTPGSSYERPDTKPYIGDGKPGCEYIQINQVRARQLGRDFAAPDPTAKGYCIGLYDRDYFRLDRSPRNQSLEAALATSGKLDVPYRGPVVALRELPKEFHGDITFSDYRHIIDYFAEYRVGGAPWVPHSPPTSIKIRMAARGAKVYSNAKHKVNNLPRFTSVPTAAVTWIMQTMGTLSHISAQLGMPLCLWKYPGPNSADESPRFAAGGKSGNEHAASLMMNINVFSPVWGFPSSLWMCKTGDVFVARTDGKELDPRY